MKSVFLESHNIQNPNFGFGQFNYHLIKGLYNAKIENFKLTLHSKNTPALKKEFGDCFDYKNYSSLSRHPLFRIRKEYDVWHSLNQNIKIEPYHNIPYVMTIHDVNFIEEESSDMTHKRNIRFKEKLNRCNAITYISEFAKTSTHQFFDVPNIPEYVIYNGNPIREIIITDDFIPKLVPKKPFLFFIGELTERKNIHTLVELLHLLPDYELVLSGKNNTRYVNDRVAETISKTQTKNRVLFTGKISEADKQYYLKHCSAFVFPSLREGFGLPAIEAMRFGKPVFLANRTSLPEIGGEYAFYWDTFEPEHMFQVFEEGMHTYQTNLEDYKEAYISRAKSFDWDASAREYENVYRTLL